MDTAERELRTLDVRQGDRLLVVAENRANYVVLIIACNRVGAWPVALMREWQPVRDRLDVKADARVCYFTWAPSSAAREYALRLQGKDSTIAAMMRTDTRSRETTELLEPRKGNNGRRRKPLGQGFRQIRRARPTDLLAYQ
ncbi:hypothetical protein P0R27_37015 [Bradyrhizobium yuanmingense]|nr:hypothetical protein [Bradyrhizobium yuanmingense]MDF0498885.1 hypothetical protein [Bradyrhizobium yuanmingense]